MIYTRLSFFANSRALKFLSMPIVLRGICESCASVLLEHRASKFPLQTETPNAQHNVIGASDRPSTRIIHPILAPHKATQQVVRKITALCSELRMRYTIPSQNVTLPVLPNPHFVHIYIFFISGVAPVLHARQKPHRPTRKPSLPSILQKRTGSANVENHSPPSHIAHAHNVRSLHFFFRFHSKLQTSKASANSA